MLDWPMSSPQMMTMFGLGFVWARAGAAAKNVVADSLPATSGHSLARTGVRRPGYLTTNSFGSEMRFVQPAVGRCRDRPNATRPRHVPQSGIPRSGGVENTQDGGQNPSSPSAGGGRQ